jgi:hypothetical protein
MRVAVQEMRAGRGGGAGGGGGSCCAARAEPPDSQPGVRSSLSPAHTLNYTRLLAPSVQRREFPHLPAYPFTQPLYQHILSFLAAGPRVRPCGGGGGWRSILLFGLRRLK